jgi:hypothetical protein
MAATEHLGQLFANLAQAVSLVWALVWCSLSAALGTFLSLFHPRMWLAGAYTPPLFSST